MGTLKIKDLKFSYDDNTVFKGVNFTLRKGKTLSIIGVPGSGKTTLLKILNGELLNYDGEVFINGIMVESANFDALRRCIAVVYNNSSFLTETVKSELRFSLENLNVAPKDIKYELDELNEYFGINKILDDSLDSLNVNDRTLIKILSYVVMKPSYIALDDLLVFLNNRTKILLLNYLNSKEITLINVTSNMEDVLYTDYVLCLYDGISAIDGKTLDVLENEKVLKRLGFDLPFMVDLSLQLQFYGLITKVYLNSESMVKNLWK